MDPLPSQTFLSKLSIRPASKFFTGFVKELQTEKELNSRKLKNATFGIKALRKSLDSVFTSDTILHQLAPVPDGSCTGFSAHILVILSTNNEELLYSALDFLGYTLGRASQSLRLEFLQTDFFVNLSPTFLQHDMHLLQRTVYDMMVIIRLYCFSWMSRLRSDFFTTVISLDAQARYQAILDKCLKPVELFITSLGRKRFQIQDHSSSSHYAMFFVDFLDISSLHEPTTDYILSLPICFTVTNFLAYFTDDEAMKHLLNGVDYFFDAYQCKVRERRSNCCRILVALDEEGISDELDQILIQSSKQHYHSYHAVNVSVRSIRSCGANCRYDIEADRYHEILDE